MADTKKKQGFLSRLIFGNKNKKDNSLVNSDSLEKLNEKPTTTKELDESLSKFEAKNVIENNNIDMKGPKNRKKSISELIFGGKSSNNMNDNQSQNGNEEHKLDEFDHESYEHDHQEEKKSTIASLGKRMPPALNVNLKSVPSTPHLSANTTLHQNESASQAKPVLLKSISAHPTKAEAVAKAQMDLTDARQNLKKQIQQPKAEVTAKTEDVTKAQMDLTDARQNLKKQIQQPKAEVTTKTEAVTKAQMDLTDARQNLKKQIQQPKEEVTRSNGDPPITPSQSILRNTTQRTKLLSKQESTLSERRGERPRGTSEAVANSREDPRQREEEERDDRPRAKSAAGRAADGGEGVKVRLTTAPSSQVQVTPSAAVDDVQKQQRLAASALRRQSLFKTHGGEGAFLTPSNIASSHLLGDVQANATSTEVASRDPNEGDMGEGLSNSHSILGVPANPSHPNRRRSTASEIRIANFKNQNYKGVTNPSLFSKKDSDANTIEKQTSEARAINRKKSMENVGHESLQMPDYDYEGLSEEEIQHLKDEHEKWKLIPKQAQSSGVIRSVAYRLFYDVDSDLPPILATKPEDEDKALNAAGATPMLVAGTLGAELIKLIEETNIQKVSSKSNNGEKTKPSWNKKPSMLIDPSRLKAANDAKTEEEVNKVAQEESDYESGSEAVSVNDGDSLCSDETMDEVTYLRLIASLPGIDTQQEEEYWEMKKNGKDLGLSSQPQGGSKAAAQLIMKAKKMASETLSKDDGVNAAKGKKKKKKKKRGTVQFSDENNLYMIPRKLSVGEKVLLNTMVPLRIGMDDEWKQHALSSNNGKVPHRIGRSFLIDDDVNTTQGRASSHRIDQAALNEILAMNEQLDYEDRYADMDDVSVGGESAASVAVCGPSRKPRFRDTVWGRSADYLQANANSTDATTIAMKAKAETKGKALLTKEFGPYLKKERWEGLEVFNKKPRIALANPESSHKQLISASDAVSRMKGKL